MATKAFPQVLLGFLVGYLVDFSKPSLFHRQISNSQKKYPLFWSTTFMFSSFQRIRHFFPLFPTKKVAVFLASKANQMAPFVGFGISLAEAGKTPDTVIYVCFWKKMFPYLLCQRIQDVLLRYPNIGWDWIPSKTTQVGRVNGFLGFVNFPEGI